VRWGWRFAGLDFAAHRAAVVWLTALAMDPGVKPGLKAFRERQLKQRKTLGCGVNRPGESGDYGIAGEGLVTYRAQGWAAISAWSWVVV
jgi:hypothetical protein